MELGEKNEYWSEKFEGLDLSESEISSKKFDGCTFTDCNFSEATLGRCEFVGCEFTKCNLSVVNIEYSKFSDVVFRESKLVGINWTRASWSSLVINSPIEFYKSIVNDCSFSGLSLQGVVLEECKAHRVDFRDGDFSNANFTFTDLSGSLFGNTNLTGANFSDAGNYDIDIYRNKISRAKFCRIDAIRLLGSLNIEFVD